jgi:ribosome-binding factor A
MAGYRAERLGDEIMARIAEILRTVKDPRLQRMISITRVEVSSDARYAKVYVSTLGDESDLAEVMKGFRSCSGYIRRELAHAMQLRYTPELSFAADPGILRGRRTLDIMKQLGETEDGH